MTTKILPGIRSLICILILSASGYAQAEEPVAVAPLDSSQLRDKINEEEGARAALAKELASFIQKNSSTPYGDIEGIGDALFYAGKWHMIELAPYMLQFLNSTGLDAYQEPSVDVLHRQRPSEGMESTAKFALASLGNDAIAPILDAVRNTVKSENTVAPLDNTLPNAGEVLVTICGNARARELVNAAINDEHDPANKARLENFLNYIPTEAGSPAPTEETPAPAPMPEAHPSPATQEKPATEPTEETAPPAQTVSPAPAAGFPWYASGIIGLVLGGAATFVLTRKK